MRRRRFIKSTGGFLLGLAGQGLTPLGLSANLNNSGDSDGSLVTLFLGGDVMTGRGIDQVLAHPSDPVLYESRVKNARTYVELAEQAHGPIPRPVDHGYIWGDALEVLDAVRPQARIINLETSITTSDEPWPGKGIHYRMHPDNTGCLSAAGINCCALANNHTLDWGFPGLEETLDTLAHAGIHTAGAGKNLKQARDPAVIPLGDNYRLLVYSMAVRNSGTQLQWGATPTRPGLNEIIELWEPMTRYATDRIRSQKAPGDVMVASIHWGRNWGYGVPRDQREFAGRLIEAGADVVHGHSSHHTKGIEVVNGRPVIYGCGDLINDYEGIEDENDRFRGELALLYFVTLDAATGELHSLNMKPMRTRNFRLNHASGEETQWLLDLMHREGQKLNTSVALGEDQFLTLGW
jgi:poly-gamma-glutamate synthesis protein (capsule biosynthesis protein)